MTKAFAYLRVSSAGQVDGDGFPRQREAIETFCRRHHYEIVQEFRDEGVSGTREIGKREGLSGMLLAIAANGVRTVMVERADRIARALMVSEVILEEFRKLDVKVISVDSGNDLTADDDPTKVLFRQLMGVIAQWEKSALVKKLRLARERIRASGQRCDGAKPFGEKDGERIILSRMLSLKSQGKNAREIADTLNEENAATRFKGKWHRTSVWRILKAQKEG